MSIEPHLVSKLFIVMPSIVVDVKRYSTLGTDMQKVTLTRTPDACCIARKVKGGFRDELSGTPIFENLKGHINNDTYYVDGNRYLKNLISYLWESETGIKFKSSMETYLASLKPFYSDAELIKILEERKEELKASFPDVEYVKRVRFGKRHLENYLDLEN